MAKKYHRYSPVNVICPTCGNVVRKVGVGVDKCLACGAEIPEDAELAMGESGVANAAGGTSTIAAPGGIAAPGEIAAPGASAAPGSN